MKEVFILIFIFISFCGPPKPLSRSSTSIASTANLTEEEITKKLHSPIWTERSGILVEIQRIEGRKFIPEIRKLLDTDPEAAVRGTAALVLSHFQDETSCIRIARMLEEDKVVSPEILLDALSKFSEPKVVKYILPFMEDDSNTRRLLAMKALIRNQATFEKNSILKMANQNTDPQKAKTYAMLIGNLKIKEGESYLIKLANNSSPSPTLAAAYLALGRIQSQKAIPILVNALKANFPKGIENAELALIKIASPKVNRLVLPLLNNEQEELKIIASNILAEIPDVITAEVVLSRLQKKESKLIPYLTFILGKYKYTKARTRIEEFLLDTTLPGREKIAQSLGWMGESQSVPTLLKVLKEEEGEGRYGAVWALGILEAKEALEPLKNAVESSDRKLSLLAIQALSSLRLEDSLNVLEKKTKEKESAYFAYSAIANIPGQKALDILHEGAKKSDSSMRRAAFQAMEQRKDGQSIPFLISQLEKEGESQNRSLIIAALNHITGEKIYQVQDWKIWWERKGK
ncbi:MAG: HEAT repeat domain-containing protein [Leptospiraceae bacterium]|nr:HEAT repeat domain-containing protein [Leptospiraceae bacterium]